MSIDWMGNRSLGDLLAGMDLGELDGAVVLQAQAVLLVLPAGVVQGPHGLGLGGDTRVDLLLPSDAALPPVGVQVLRRVRLLEAARTELTAGRSNSAQEMLDRATATGLDGEPRSGIGTLNRERSSRYFAYTASSDAAATRRNSRRNWPPLSAT